MMNALNPLAIGLIEPVGAEPSELETLSPEKVQEELRRILNSAQFDASDRNRRFLTYVVNETLAGRGERIKAYNIATIVFGRDDSFDPQLDPVVRMEARRLRRSLERFYLFEGELGPVRIAMPKGGYLPKFQGSAIPQRGPNLDADDPGCQPTPPSAAVSIFVSPFEVEDDRLIYRNHGEALSRHIAVGLSRFPEVGVFTLRADFRSDAQEDRRFAAAGQHSGFALGGNATLLRNVLRLTATLVDEQSGKLVWGETFEENFADKGLLQAREIVANRVVRALARRLDALVGDRRRELNPNAAQMGTSLDGLMSFNRYRRSFQSELFLAARNSLERLFKPASQDCEAIACLSQIYSDGHRFGWAREPAIELRARASKLAKRAAELSPDSSRACHAQGIALWFTRDADSSLDALRKAFALNPNATDTIADLGLHLCLRGEWAEGVPLLNEARDGHPVRSGLPQLGLSLYHFFHGQFEQAHAEAKEIQVEHAGYGSVAQAIALVRLGRKDEASESVARIRASMPNDGRDVLDGLGGTNIQSELAGKVNSALHDAGWRPPPP